MKRDILSLEQAFVYTISFKYFYRRCKMSCQWASSIRKRYEAGSLSNDKMREVVIRSGYFYRSPETFIKKDIDDI